MNGKIVNDSSSESRDTTTTNMDYYGIKKWELGFMRKECENLGLEQYYIAYMHRIQRSYLSIFVVLQTIVCLTHVIILAVADAKDLPIYPDILCYTFSILIVWIALFPAFKEHLVKTYPWVPYVTSFIAISTIVLTDIVVPIYHAVVTHIHPPLRPAYESHVLLAVYIFLPLSDNWHAITLGVATSLSYLIVMLTITFRLDEDKIDKIIIEAIYLGCLNIFGMYFRLINEIATRRTFLDRRDLVEGNLMLKFARNQEKELLLSILPEHTAELMEKDIRAIIQKIRKDQRKSASQQKRGATRDSPVESIFDQGFTTKPQWRSINKLYVKKHTDVTILYADVVNYTQMTTQLPVRTLVETLHELFVKFDEASKEFNVLRIKFLGDCYYCVSGVPVKNKRHAKSCVDLGLRMIKDIRDVRISRDLNIDMRIGIHSGSIISGVIGARKWQYDIWSRDVIIANTMESTGETGKVHVTMQTLELLDGEYIYEEGTEAAKNCPLLQKYNIHTYLIVPQFYEDPHFLLNHEGGVCSTRHSIGVKKRTLQRNKERKLVAKNFMQNSMEQFREIMKQTNVEMSQELDQLPIGKFQFNKIFSKARRHSDPQSKDDLDRKSLNKISWLFMCFENRRWEFSFVQERDMLLKYSVLMSFTAFLAIVFTQVFNETSGNFFWLVTGLSGTILFLFIPITWFNKIWDTLREHTSENLISNKQPQNCFLKALYRFSYSIMGSFFVRTHMYLFTVTILVVCSLIHLNECDTEMLDINPPSNLTKIELTRIFKDHALCMNPWSVTQCLILSICMSFLFLRIHYILKLLIGISITGFYGWIIFIQFHYIYEISASLNPAMDSKISHMMMIVFTMIMFHWIDRQTEYVARVDYNWKRQLLKKQEEAEVTKETNKLLVENILPTHVAEIYINQQLKNEFYSEEYENVAVMFATITNMEINTEILHENEKSMLKVLNEIICDFDERLQFFDGALKVEKIKVSGWTYMAACGLDPGRGESSVTFPMITRSSLMTPNGRRSLNHHFKAGGETKPSSRLSLNVVIVMAEFALELMRVMRLFNEENFKQSNPALLRVGISHGKVMAGVVGSSKPLYDIWGNAVNMASRMDSTGIPGMIQVTEQTSEVLQSFGFECENRGEIYVKGRGRIPTYFIRIDEDLNFVKQKKKFDQRLSIFQA